MQKQSEERQNEQDDEKAVTRRTFLSYVNVAIGGFITVLLGIPLIGSAVLPALRRGEENLVSAGPVSSFNVGEPKAANLTITVKDGWVVAREDRGVWVVKKSDTDFAVYNGRCVHLGCAYSWSAQARQFQCPCHGGLYALDGKVMGGPPPRGLDTLNWKVEGGNLVVDYRDFLLGVPKKEEI